jgi:methylmalonyl-CoA mutase N-terminal domain/subunit
MINVIRMVGVNKYAVPESSSKKMETLYIDRSVEKEQIERLAALKKKRSASAVQAALRGVREAAQGDQNLCEPILQAVKCYATLQEICDELRGVYGIYREAGTF